jgi:D-serine deaminase-like pyridoxal phosphate-dependent protein
MKATAMIKTPTIVLDKDRCLENIRKMTSVAREANVCLRPHCKTHASLEIARWFREEGVTCITVSSLSMAEYFAPEWNDITVAFPVNILEIDTIKKMLSSYEDLRLNLLVENTEAVEALESSLTTKVGVFIKIDVGYGRTGIPARETDRIDEILIMLKTCDHVHFLGFLTHAGHSYHCHSVEDINQVFISSRDLMVELKRKYISEFPVLQLSFGDTPCCSVVDPKQLAVFDEIRPGNFVFYDLEQSSIGS